MYDVIIVGSGYGGSIPALRLAQAGMKVLVLERGKRYSTQDFRQSDDPAYLQSVLDYVLGSSNIGFRTGTLMGGASMNMDGAFFRTPTFSFEQRDKDGRRYWPEAFNRQELDKYYPRVEQMLKVRQRTWEEIPKSGGLFAQICEAAGVSVNLALMNYTDCVQCGFCAQGCTFDKKMTLMHTYIPAAEALGVEFRAQTQVSRVEREGTGYRVHFSGGSELTPRVVIGAGGIHTPALLMRSGFGGDHVGRHFNTNGEHAYMGILPDGFEGTKDFDTWKGMDNAGLMSFHFLQSHGFTLHPGGGFEPSVMAANIAAPDRSWGMEYKRFAEKTYRRNIIGFSTLGLSDPHLQVTLRSDGNADVVLADRTAHDAYLERVETQVQAMAAASGVTIVDAIAKRYSGMTSAHLLSSARMAEKASDGVVDSNGRVFGHDNLYICDASTLPYALGVNPALTISAIAERTAERIISHG